MARKSYNAKQRETVFHVWRLSGQSATDTLKTLKEEYRWPLGRQTLYNWIERYGWEKRAAELDVEEAKVAASQAQGMDGLLADLIRQKTRYERYFAELEGVDPDATTAYANLCKNIDQMQQRGERQRDEEETDGDDADAPPPPPIEDFEAEFEAWCKERTPRWNWDWAHLRKIRSALGRFYRREAPNLIITVPPRHGKSEQTTKRAPAFLLERHPDRRVIVGCYNQQLANKFSRAARKLTQVRLSKDLNTAQEWETEADGGFRAVGVGAGVTGHGADWIYIDDPVKSREEANSATYREKVWEWFKDDLYTRLEPGGGFVLIMTRWHHDDLAGRILADEELSQDTEVLHLPAIADEPNDPLGREIGEALCPERYDVPKLKKLEALLGDSFLALYQGRPTKSSGDVIHSDWWRRYPAVQSSYRRVIQSWDTAQKDKERNDYNVCTTWGETHGGELHLLHVYRERLQYPALKRIAIAMAMRWRPDVVLIEDKGHGTALLQEFKGDTETRKKVRHLKISFIAVMPESDKVGRMEVEADQIKAGRVFLPEAAPWLPEFEQECSHFPAVAHDDQVDSMSQALFYLGSHWRQKRADYTAFTIKGL
ncbi:phage terminase large subunit [Endothiovibrio diazotrophicus]